MAEGTFEIVIGDSITATFYAYDFAHFEQQHPEGWVFAQPGNEEIHFGLKAEVIDTDLGFDIPDDGMVSIAALVAAMEAVDGAQDDEYAAALVVYAAYEGHVFDMVDWRGLGKHVADYFQGVYDDWEEYGSQRYDELVGDEYVKSFMDLASYGEDLAGGCTALDGVVDDRIYLFSE